MFDFETYFQLYPFFKCKCKPLWDGYRCQWFNCPCQNGGKCRPCLRGKCVDQPKCSCPNGFKGPMCQTPVPTKRPTTTSMPRTTTARTTTPRVTTPRTTTPKQTRPTRPPRPNLPAQWGPWSAWTECNDRFGYEISYISLPVKKQITSSCQFSFISNES